MNWIEQQLAEMAKTPKLDKFSQLLADIRAVELEERLAAEAERRLQDRQDMRWGGDEEGDENE